ncbi:MAG TPA: MarR family transcriptional regulator [Mycobacteriales bacterium]
MATGKRLAGTASELNSAAIHLLRALRATDRAAGLTPARLSALSVLVFGGPRPLGRLARTEDVAGPTMTRIVDGLCDLGLAERRPHPDGGRLVLVAATAEGERVMRAARQARIDTIVTALRALPAADRAAITAASPALLRLADQVRDTG